MAFGRRGRRFRSRGGRRRPIDWVTTGQTYSNSSARYEVTQAGERINYSLTTHQDFGEATGASGLVAGRSVPQLEQTVLRVKGQIALTLEYDTSWWENATGWCIVTHRIRVADQIPGTIDIQEPDLTNLVPDNMGHATFAQESFLWENREIWYANAAWGEFNVEPLHQPRVINVDVTSKRRLEVGQSLSLMTEVILQPDGENQPGTWPDMLEIIWLRTLLRTIT